MKEYTCKTELHMAAKPSQYEQYPFCPDLACLCSKPYTV